VIYDAAKIPSVQRQQVTYVAGLDLAMQRDSSALSVLRCQKAPDGSIRLSLVHLDRWWASYPETHRHVVQTLSRPPLPGRCLLAVDSTGVGLSWVETFKLDPQVRQLVGDDRLVPMTITSGRAVTRSGQFLRVGKYTLISELRTALAHKTLTIAKNLPLLPELLAELDGFEAHLRTNGSVAMGNNAKLVAHDDLVLSVALGVVAARVVFGEVER
jgi:hypothetical protein